MFKGVFMRIFWNIIVAISVIASCNSVFANDSTARVGAGGITFQKSADIRMVREDLKISKKAINVRYRFLNESDKDILTTVAFPMPAYTWNPGVDASVNNNVPLTDFLVKVDGIKIKTKKIRRAFLGKRDITDSLKDAGLTDGQIFDTFGDMTLENGPVLNKSQQSKLEAIGAVKHGAPVWQVAETAYWEQLFPAKKIVEVEHKYKPFVGSIFAVPHQGQYGLVGDYVPAVWGKRKNEACTNKTIRKAIYKQIKNLLDKGKNGIMVYLDHVEYILGTGRNWKGPIEDFTLMIEKESPDQIVSTCFPGTPKHTGKIIEFSKKNFVPQDKLIVYFYTVKTD